MGSRSRSCLFVSNIDFKSRSEELKKVFERFGPVVYVHHPKDYRTGKPRCFCFVEFHNPLDAAEAKRQMNDKTIGSRQVSVLFAKSNRKTPQEMRMTERISGRDTAGGFRRRSSSRSPLLRHRANSRSPPPPRHDGSIQLRTKLELLTD